jgi:hypothetical protein
MMYTVYMKMENGQQVVWEGTADDSRHAEGLAYAYANELTGEQIYDSDYEEWEQL